MRTTTGDVSGGRSKPFYRSATTVRVRIKFDRNPSPVASSSPTPLLLHIRQPSSTIDGVLKSTMAALADVVSISSGRGGSTIIIFPPLRSTDETHMSKQCRLLQLHRWQQPCSGHA
ncbi:hypothetical protein ACLOJK_014636 [Asimina triloba]